LLGDFWVRKSFLFLKQKPPNKGRVFWFFLVVEDTFERRPIMKVGVELEGFVYYRGSQYEKPVDVYRWLLENYNDEEWEVEDGNGTIVKTDAGYHMIELALPPVDIRDLGSIPETINSIVREFPRNWEFRWQGYDPGRLPAKDLWAPKQRYFALKKALKMESPENWWRVEEISKIASVHVHLDVDFQDRDRVVALLNIFNNADGLRERFATRQRANKWFGWADPRRLPNKKNGRIFSSYKDLEEFIGAIPRLLKQENGGLEPDLNTRCQLGDRLSESTLWWWARPRKSLRTIEVRIADSMNPRQIPQYIGELLAIAKLV